MRTLVARFMATKPVWAFLLVCSIPAVIGYAGFLSVRWTYRLIRNGLVAILLATSACCAAAYLYLGHYSALAALTTIIGIIGLWFSYRGELFVVWWRAQYRYWTKYRWYFKTALRAAGLTSYDPKHPGVKARIIDGGVTANEFVDILEVHMSPHQRPEDYQRQIDGIRRTLGAVGGRAVSSRKSVQNVTLWLWKTDPLNRIVHPYPHRPPPADDDWDAWFRRGLQVARLEDGSPFSLDLITVPFHWLLAGSSRSGKSGAIGSLMGAGESALRKKAWLIDAIDPAMGMELVGYDRAGLFHRFVHAKAPDHIKGMTLDQLYEKYGDAWMAELGPDFAADVAEMVHRFYLEMRHRGASLFGKARVFTPSVATPLRTLLVDEIATVMALGVVEIRMSGVVMKVNIKAEMEEILRQGLKCGFQVIGAVQDPLKSQVEIRDLFTYFTCFGGVGQVGFDKLFGQHAYKNAGSPKIPKRLQGVAYTGTNVLSLEQIALLADEYDETIRVRFTWEADADIEAMALRRYDDGAATFDDLPAREPAGV